MTIRFPVLRAGLLAGFALLSATGAHASSFSTLEERMSAKQFRDAGLEKLTDEELAALNAWLQGQSTTAAPAMMAAPTPESRVGFRESNTGSTVVSYLVGTFTGWDGKTKFELENGQIWQQVEQGRVSGVSIERPQVTIESGMFGSWKIKIEGLNATTRVKRIQ